MKNIQIAVIGLGYVGLPLARLFAAKYPVVGFDINKNRIEELNNSNDSTLEVSNEELQKVITAQPFSASGLFCTSNAEFLQKCNYYIITVPTPVDKSNHPDLHPLFSASGTVGRAINKNDIVIYESTVSPGITEDVCIPIVEKVSGLSFNKDFFAGYSPERINPGDKLHTVETILKITSGSTPEVAQLVDELYRSVITAGTYLAPSIRVAEAAKIIENSQRDINIAFINELAKIFNRMGIDTRSVLQAAATKWNFLPFYPGLVGGHCIGVDPYYLAQRAREYGFRPEIILSGRRMNDGMGEYVAQEVVRCMIKKEMLIKHSRVLILGFTFKENCPDVRNTKVIDVVHELQNYDIDVTVYDPIASREDVKREYGLEIASELPSEEYDAVIAAVAHKEFISLNVRSLVKKEGVVYDVKGIYPLAIVDARL
ncbi:nucleotide sugar dehydrogenase [uncultured Bacteroides sp.]|uniref:nucleotide sugar dehydrogenase n=1 Tax=uncultured Bacteroides sp. TaxID=162156 RepID=UPI002AAB9D2D|nr:nucleotide sugar dehydrogenase [uncultured Bacteroides sp.]